MNSVLRRCWRQTTSSSVPLPRPRPAILRARPLSTVQLPAPDIPKARSVLLTSPTPADIDAQELDAELIHPDHIHVLLTTRAAEQLQRIATREANHNVALHVSVESGGCHGYQYKLRLATTRAPEDYHLTHPDVRPSNIYVDAITLPMINGATIDYATELIGSSFRITGNPQAKGGCGCGISWELKE
ncbi:iron-sulfur cluster assembly accessory protein Isa2 [Lanmaoa asiatica]|nr:iron-sulfur cluster assembly accessory protein Isa2 [Lanmaoa asiatica]